MSETSDIAETLRRFAETLEEMVSDLRSIAMAMDGDED